MYGDVAVTATVMCAFVIGMCAAAGLWALCTAPAGGEPVFFASEFYDFYDSWEST